MEKVRKNNFKMAVVATAFAVSLIGLGRASYAAPLDSDINKHSASASHHQAAATVKNKQPGVAQTTKLQVQTTINQVPSNWAPGAKAASDRYEALEHGRPLPGTDQIQLIMHGYVPPGMPPQQAAMLYNSLPNNLKTPHVPQSGTPEWVSRMAGEPADPTAGLPMMGATREGIAAQNQKILEESVRERFGPMYIPPLHRDHNRAAQPAGIAIPQYSYTKDHIGSVREMTDSSGNIVSQYGYDPYGRQTQIAGSGPQSDFGYQGYYVHPRSGLNLTATRAYSPSLGRFLNRDLIGEDGGVNLFAYVHNDPINHRDPSGMWQWYGNWGGPNWTNGQEGSATNNQGENSNFPNMNGQPGFRKPWDPRDRCYYWHDVCLHNAARINNNDSRQCRRNYCDKELAKCLQYVQDTYPGQFGGIPDREIAEFNQPNSPNNRPGEYVPGLTPYPPNYDPGVINPGVPKQ